MFLTPADLEQLTGYSLPAWQAKWLAARGWRFERSRSGAVLVLRSHAESMMGGEAPRAPGQGEVSNWKPPWLEEPWRAEGMRPMEWLDKNFTDYLVTRDQVIERAVERAKWDTLPEHGFYFLTRVGSVVYVGISNGIHWRLEQHWANNRNFSRAYAIAAPQMVAQQMEAFYYEAWRPELNVRRERLAGALRHRLPKAPG